MDFSTDEQFALQLDAEDPLRLFREKFHLPLDENAKPLIYLAGNSLGLMPKTARKIVEQELDDWARLAVDAHLGAATPWYTYHETLREPAARLVGAQPNEIICMNSLTVNLHLMMATFYRPTRTRFKILMEEPAFPSDTYAIKTQIVHHGFDPNDALVLARPRDGEFTVRRSAMCRWRCTIGTSISRFGVHTNISTLVLALWRALSCTSGTRPIASCRAWPAGSGTTRTRASACISSRSLFPSRRLTAGRSATRRFFRWRRCARHSRSLTRPAE
jgi:hypothetical protein